MTIRDKAEKTIRKLLALTQDKNIVWERVTDTGFLTHGNDDIVDIAYTTKYGDSRFVLYESRYQTMDADERVYWDNRVQLDLVDDGWRLLWRLPSSAAVWDLLEAARLKAGNVEEKLDEFLKDIE